MTERRCLLDCDPVGVCQREGGVTVELPARLNLTVRPELADLGCLDLPDVVALGEEAFTAKTTGLIDDRRHSFGQAFEDINRPRSSSLVHLLGIDEHLESLARCVGAFVGTVTRPDHLLDEADLLVAGTVGAPA